MANKRRPQGDGTIRKRNDGRWEARIIIGHKNDGSPIYKSAFAKTQKSALKELHQLIELYRDVDLTEDCRMTLGEWLDKWLDEYMIFAIRESTLDSYRGMVKNQVKPFIGNKQLASLTTADVQKFYNRIKKEGRVRKHPVHGKTLADSMVRGVHMMLHEALDMAVKERLLAKNPTNGTTIPKCNYPEKQILGDNQLETFLEAIRGQEYWCDFFYVEVMTGLRRGEICGLKWQDIDFEENKLRVKRSVSVKRGGGVNIGETKTETGVRCIEMPPSVAELLKNRKQMAITEWVFPAFLNPEQPIHPQAAYRKLKVILKNAELPLIRFHDLRHTFATHATQGGVDPKTLAGILGHTNASFTLDTYTHVTSDMQKSASAIVGNMMKNIMIKE
ncbi:MAG: site-specific integrase [Clostridia bacterium]|nr:site-specific integrase [Clostridia bacterium]